MVNAWDPGGQPAEGISEGMHASIRGLDPFHCHS
jgi:hypothetical protein